MVYRVKQLVRLSGNISIGIKYIAPPCSALYLGPLHLVNEHTSTPAHQQLSTPAHQYPHLKKGRKMKIKTFYKQPFLLPQPLIPNDNFQLSAGQARPGA